ncbi:MAG TPA: hypothetical protein PKE04_10155, partial [Clostridia bacterium]|nr:hypothetical protein [Clostridia bacterium]
MIRSGIHTLTMGMLRAAQSPDGLRQVSNPARVVREYGPRGVGHFELSLDINVLLQGARECELAVAQTREALRDVGATCSVHLPFRGVDISYPSRDVAEGYARMMAGVVRLARPLSPMAYVVHPTGDFAKRLRDFAQIFPVLQKTWDTSLFALETLARLGGIQPEELAVENLSHPLAMNDYILERLPVSACLDAGHIAADHSGDGWTV